MAAALSGIALQKCSSQFCEVVSRVSTPHRNFDAGILGPKDFSPLLHCESPRVSDRGKKPLSKKPSFAHYRSHGRWSGSYKGEQIVLVTHCPYAQIPKLVSDGCLPFLHGSVSGHKFQIQRQRNQERRQLRPAHSSLRSSLF